MIYYDAEILLSFL